MALKISALLVYPQTLNCKGNLFYNYCRPQYNYKLRVITTNNQGHIKIGLLTLILFTLDGLLFKN
jgi:hypothetical protein